MPKRLYIGNLSYQTTEATLSDLFGAIGEVTSVSLVTDRVSGHSRGFAFIEMTDANAAQQAVNELDGKDVDGRNIKVSEARPKRPQRDSDSWGGGGGRGRSGGGG
ncbi:MAG: RNA-binding protein, partial [Chloroflexi bacterium]|nr:RNA-binding protein [Chloroflexota bacterium]